MEEEVKEPPQSEFEIKPPVIETLGFECNDIGFNSWSNIELMIGFDLGKKELQKNFSSFAHLKECIAGENDKDNVALVLYGIVCMLGVLEINRQESRKAYGNSIKNLIAWKKLQRRFKEMIERLCNGTFDPKVDNQFVQDLVDSIKKRKDWDIAEDVLKEKEGKKELPERNEKPNYNDLLKKNMERWFPSKPPKIFLVNRESKSEDDKKKNRASNYKNWHDFYEQQNLLKDIDKFLHKMLKPARWPYSGEWPNPMYTLIMLLAILPVLPIIFWLTLANIFPVFLVCLPILFANITLANRFIPLWVQIRICVERLQEARKHTGKKKSIGMACGAVFFVLLALAIGGFYGWFVSLGVMPIVATYSAGSAGLLTALTIFSLSCIIITALFFAMYCIDSFINKLCDWSEGASISWREWIKTIAKNLWRGIKSPFIFVVEWLGRIHDACKDKAKNSKGLKWCGYQVLAYLGPFILGIIGIPLYLVASALTFMVEKSKNSNQTLDLWLIERYNKICEFFNKKVTDNKKWPGRLFCKGLLAVAYFLLYLPSMVITFLLFGRPKSPIDLVNHIVDYCKEADEKRRNKSDEWDKAKFVGKQIVATLVFVFIWSPGRIIWSVVSFALGALLYCFFVWENLQSLLDTGIPKFFSMLGRFLTVPFIYLSFIADVIDFLEVSLSSYLFFGKKVDKSLLQRDSLQVAQDRYHEPPVPEFLRNFAEFPLPPEEKSHPSGGSSVTPGGGGGPCTSNEKIEETPLLGTGTDTVAQIPI